MAWRSNVVAGMSSGFRTIIAANGDALVMRALAWSIMLQSVRRVASGAWTLPEITAEFATVHPVVVDGKLSMTELPRRAVAIIGAYSFATAHSPIAHRISNLVW